MLYSRWLRRLDHLGNRNRCPCTTHLGRLYIGFRGDLTPVVTSNPAYNLYIYCSLIHFICHQMFARSIQLYKECYFPRFYLHDSPPGSPGIFQNIKVAGKLTCKVSFCFLKNNFLHTYKISAVSSMHSILSTYFLLNSTYALAETCM